MRVVDSYGINDGGMIFSVELADDRFVDVKVCPDGGPVYVMQNADGSTVYTGEWVADNTCPGYEYDENVVLDLVKSTANKRMDMIKVAIESTDDYSDSTFHSRLVDDEVLNEDGTYGKVVDFYRIVRINENGRIDKFDDRVFKNLDTARDAVLDDARLVLVSYDVLVHEAGKGLGAVVADALERAADGSSGKADRNVDFVK